MSIFPKDCLHSFQSNILGREVQIFQTSEDDVTRTSVDSISPSIS